MHNRPDRYLAGLAATAARRGVHVVSRRCGLSPEAVAHCLDELLPPSGPTGLVVHDEVALPLVLAALERGGRRVPDDVSSWRCARRPWPGNSGSGPPRWWFRHGSWVHWPWSEPFGSSTAIRASNRNCWHPVHRRGQHRCRTRRSSRFALAGGPDGICPLRTTSPRSVPSMTVLVRPGHIADPIDRTVRRFPPYSPLTADDTRGEYA